MDFSDFNIEIKDIGVHEKTNGLRWDHEFGGTIACIPASDGKRVFFGCDNNIFYALDIESGKEIWRHETGGCMGNATSVIYKDKIMVGSYDGYLYCFSKNKGNIEWRFKTGGKVVSGVAVTDGRIIFGSRDGYVYCLSHEGRELWRFRTGDEILSTPAIRDNMIYIGSYDCNLYCIDTISGTELWRFRSSGAVANLPPVNVYKDYIIFGSWDFNIYCIDRHTGKEIWRTRLGGGMIQGGTIDDEILYIGVRNNNTLYAIDIRDGHVIWQFKTEAHLHASNIEIFDDKIYFGGGTDDYGPGIIYCLTKDAEVLWTFRTDGPNWVGPSITDGKLFTGSWNCLLYRIDASSGKEIWSYRTSGAPSNEKVIDKNSFEVETIVAKEEIDEAGSTSDSYSNIPEVMFSASEYGTKSEYGGGSEYSSSDVNYK